jgi:glutamine amidotransferase
MISIAIIDYGLGNVRSVSNALLNQGNSPTLTNNPDEIMSADGVVLPGVGSFPHGISQLKKYGLIEVIKSYAYTGKPFLGICLGMQLLFTKGEEFGLHEGLDIINGEVVSLTSEGSLTGRLPHIGWNSIQNASRNSWEMTILDKLYNEDEMYFVHSYIAKPHDDMNILATTFYQGVNFCSVVKKGNIYGCQFHPEKSGKKGLHILNNFIKLSEEGNKSGTS